MFKTVRIGKVEVLPEGWMAEEKHEKGFVDVFRFSGPERYRVKMELDVRARNFMVECFPLAEQYMRKVDEDLWMLETDLCGLDNVRWFVMTTEGARMVES